MRAPHRPTTGSPSPSARMARARRLLMLGLLALLFRPSILHADPPARHDPHDIRIALRARQVLAQDAELARYTICVTVRRGIVTLWGRVPSEGLAERAVQSVRRVPGVYQARSDLVIGPVEANRDEMPKLPRAIALPALDEPAPKRDPRSRGVLAGNSREPLPTLADAAWIGRPEPRKDSAAPPAVLLPPRFGAEKETVTSAVARLLQSDVRFAGVFAEEREGIVTLRGGVAGMDHVMDLAGQISRVPGVKEVIVENVRDSLSK